jgi:hypothetical protein
VVVLTCRLVRLLRCWRRVLGDTVQAEGRRTPLQYLTDLMNDQTVDPQRRDRAAQALLPFCHARPPGQPASYNYVPKKEEAERKAKWAGYGSPWWKLLHSDEERERLEAELQSDPTERAWVEAEVKRERASTRRDPSDWRDPTTGESDLEFNLPQYPPPVDDEKF